MCINEERKKDRTKDRKKNSSKITLEAAHIHNTHADRRTAVLVGKR